jgi:hypothetical protein
MTHIEQVLNNNKYLSLFNPWNYMLNMGEYGN